MAAQIVIHLEAQIQKSAVDRADFNAQAQSLKTLLGELCLRTGVASHAQNSHVKNSPINEKKSLDSSFYE